MEVVDHDPHIFDNHHRKAMQAERVRLDSGISLPFDSSSSREDNNDQNDQVRTRHTSTSTDTGYSRTNSYTGESSAVDVFSDTAETPEAKLEESTCIEEKLGKEPLNDDENNNRKTDIIYTKRDSFATHRSCSFPTILPHLLKCHRRRKTLSVSEVYIEDEIRSEKIAKPRKRCKSENTSEEDPLLQVQDKIVIPVKFGKQKNTEPLQTSLSPFAELYSSTRSSSGKCIGAQNSVDENSEKTHPCDVSESVTLILHHDIGDNEVDSDDSLARDETSLSMLDLKTEQPKEKITKWLNKPEDDDEKYDSLKVAVDEHEFVIDTDQVKSDNVQILREKDNARVSCFGECQERYAELHARIDGLTHGFQATCHNKFDKIPLTLIQFKRFTLKVAVGLVAVVICSLCIIPTTLVVGKVLDGQGRFLEEREWNFTKSIAGLKEDFSSVASMVNEIMTRPRSVIQVTSDDFVAQGNMLYLRWKAEEHSGQGNLRLSNSKDSIEFVNGGYYQIFSKLYYSTTLNTTANIKLQYNIHQRKSQSSQHAIKEFTATRGAMRHELMTQTTMYMYPGEEILISFDRDQQKYIANFQGAHQLGVFELN